MLKREEQKKKIAQVFNPLIGWSDEAFSCSLKSIVNLLGKVVRALCAREGI